MAKYAISAFFGVLSVGWLLVVYATSQDYLYIWLPVREGVDYCAQFFDRQGACRGVAYLSLWLMESPILLLTFLSAGLVAYALSKVPGMVAVSKPAVVAGYLSCYLVWVNLGGYGSAISTWYNVGVSLYHGGLFLGCLWVASHLTKSLSRPPTAPA